MAFMNFPNLNPFDYDNGQMHDNNEYFGGDDRVSPPGFPSGGGPSGPPFSGQQGFPPGLGGFPGFPGQQPGFPGQQPGFPGQQPGFPGQQPGFPGQQPGFPGQQPGFPPGQQPGGFPSGGGQQEGPPSSPPPSFTPQMQQQQGGVTAFAVDPGAIRGCLHRFTYIWLTNGRGFWFYPTFVGRNSVAGWRWRNFRWTYYGTDLRRIRSFRCV